MPIPRRGRVWVVLALGLALLALGYALVGIATQKAGRDVVHIAGIAEAQEIFGGVPQEGDRLGSSDAPVSIQVFNDLQCSSCREDFLGTIPGLVEKLRPPRRREAALPPLLGQSKARRSSASTAPRPRRSRAMAGSTPTSSSATRTRRNASASTSDFLDSVAGGIEELNEPEWLAYLEDEGGSDGAISQKLDGYEELGTGLGIRTRQAAIVSGPGGTRTLQDGPDPAPDRSRDRSGPVVPAPFWDNRPPLGAWRSLVARTVRVGEVPGSNPGAPMSWNPLEKPGSGVFEDGRGSNEVAIRAAPPRSPRRPTATGRPAGCEKSVRRGAYGGKTACLPTKGFPVMPTPKTNFRLSEADKEALDLVAESWGVDRTTAIRRLIFAEVEASDLASEARESLLQRLTNQYGANATLSVTLDGPAVVEASIDGKALEGARATLLFGAGGEAAAELRLDADNGPGSIAVGKLQPIVGEITLTTQLASLGAQ